MAMKNLLLIVFIAVLVHARDVTQEIERSQLNGDAIIRQLFEMLKYYIKNGDAGKNLPILDPVQIEYGHAEVSLPSKILSLEAGFQNGVISGLSDFQLDEAVFMKEQIAVNLSITFKSIVIKSEYYKMEGDIYGAVPIAGEGSFELEVKDFKFSGRTFLEQSVDGKSILIKNISNPGFSIRQIHCNTEIDGIIDDIVNTMVDDLLATYLTRFNKYLAKTYIANVIDYLNPFFNKFESWRLLAAVL